MSAILSTAKRIISRIAGRSITFKQAVGLSVAGHIVLFLALGVVAGFLEMPYMHNPPLVFDFIFRPADELAHQSQNGAMRDLEQQGKSKTKSTGSSSTEPRAGKPDEEIPPAQANGAAPATPENPAQRQPQIPPGSMYEATEPEPFWDMPQDEPVFVPHEPKNELLEQEFFVDAVEPSAFRKARKRPDRPNLVPAKLAISPQQQKMLQKKIEKWAHDFHKMDFEDADSTIIWKHKDKIYSARFQHLPARNSTGIDRVRVEVTTEENGRKLSTEMRMKRLAFSNFAQFVDYWDPQVAVHDDELIGRFHSNSRINVSHSFGVKPKFHGKVTTASWDVKTSGEWPILDEQAVFLGGLETGVKEIHLPKKFLPFVSDSTVPGEQVLRLQGESWLVFHADGTVTWWTEENPKPQQQTIHEEAHYFIGSKDGDLHLQGIVRGKVLVYSPGKIMIDGSITYARHPETSLAAEDYLGIVSDKDIEIAHPSVTGPGDLHIHAAMYARGRFRVRHLRGDGDATLYVYGSLTAGSLSATEPRYATHIRFDRRLESSRPPRFPMSSRYELEKWDGKWQIKPE